jgi:DNA processing protein
LSRRGGRRSIRICTAERAEADLAAAARAGARIVFTIEPGYPPALASVEAPPPLLYVKGRTEHLSRPMVAIVGSRNASAAGQALTRTIAERLGQKGYVIASGLARGIDSAAHAAAIDSGTVAVLAGGVDVVYPPENEALQTRIAETGCLISEQPPGFQPRGQDFPRRNRIISGVSLAILVVEAARRSGSLITARMANEQGRQVFAVPGHPLDPRSEGTNELIKSGATLVASADDIIADLAPSTGIVVEAGLPSTPLREDARQGDPVSFVEPGDTARGRVLEALGPAPVAMDELVRATGLSAREIQVVLLELAVAGRIERHGSGLTSLLPG